MAQHPTQDTAGIIALPPLIYAVALIIGWLIEYFFPTQVFGAPLKHVLGWPLLAAGVTLQVTGLRAFKRAQTPVNPFKPSTALITSGPFAYTRNPLYVALTLDYMGLTLLTDTAWPWLLLPAVLLIMYYGVILREERYMENKFGDDYRQYKARVRRWWGRTI
ncbi:MAG: isoprenylcysteine carboxylmethyltransferase family protein [Pseudomonadota bacterium]